MQGIPSLGELKLRYYELMITYHQHYHNYLEICRCYKAIFESEGVDADPAVWKPVSSLVGCHFAFLHDKVVTSVLNANMPQTEALLFFIDNLCPAWHL